MILDYRENSNSKPIGCLLEEYLSMLDQKECHLKLKITRPINIFNIVIMSIFNVVYHGIKPNSSSLLYEL